ncbi:MAG: hypothetical protein BRD48_04930 [Bacteroidetes bacterium QS_9_68_14]|nr:MAG: hypothetical protein BRD48_04930 [Bacteroidetes bacterium QS_9_68_14]
MPNGFHAPLPVKGSLRFPLALLPFLLVGAAACGGSDASPSAASQLAVENFAFAQLENGKRVFSGDVYNPTERSVQRAQISISLLDANNRQVGTTTISLPDIAPQDTTSFRQVFRGEQDVRGARVKRLTVM